MAHRINEHAFDAKARSFARGAGVVLAVIAFCGLICGACLGCHAVIVDTGRAIVHP